MPEISVIMSVYNTPKEWLKQSIDSILNQTYTDFEFLIILDKPTDESESIVKDYALKDSRIKIIFNETNIGLTKSLNEGLKLATGKYIARMDSDDISSPDRFYEQYSYMETNKNVTAVGSFIYNWNYNSGQKIIQYWDHIDNYDPEITSIRLLFFNAGLPHPTAFIRASFLKEHKIFYNPLLKTAQDYNLWVNICRNRGIIKILPKILLTYRVHSNQVSSKKYNQQSLDSMYTINSQLDRFQHVLSKREKDAHFAFYKDSTHINNTEYYNYLIKLVGINNQKQIYNKNKFKREIFYIVLKTIFKRGHFQRLWSKTFFKCFRLEYVLYYLRKELEKYKIRHISFVND